MPPRPRRGHPRRSRSTRWSNPGPPPGANARLEPLARVRALDSFDHANAPRQEWCDPDERVAPEAGQPRPASTVAASTRWGATLTLATSSPAATVWPSNTVNTSRGRSG
jgi:hypothetical protein